jgi:hypothetical protein
MHDGLYRANAWLPGRRGVGAHGLRTRMILMGEADQLVS